MTGLPWYKCNPRDLNEGMMGMPPEERGVYVTVLNLIYQRGEPIPDDPAWLASWCGCTTKAWLKIRASLIVKGKLFEVCHNSTPSLMNRRAASEIAARADLIETRAEAGARGGRKPRAEHNKNNGVAEANAKQTPTKDQAIKTVDTDTTTEAKASSVVRAKDRASRKCPSSWFPDASVFETGAVEGFSPGEIERELSKMRDHTFGTTRSDWDATARNWLKTAADRIRPRAPNGQRLDPNSAKLAARQANLEADFLGSEIAAEHWRRTHGSS